MPSVRILLSILTGCLFLSLYGCGSDDNTSQQDGDTDTDSIEEVEESEILQGDMDAEAEEELEEVEPPATLEAIAFTSEIEPITEQVFDLDADGRSCQIHVTVRFDGVGVWIVYNRPDEQNKFDVYATRIALDGQTLVAPFKVNTADFNETEPDLALAADRVAFVWQSDNGESPNNLSIHYRTYSFDGTPIMDEDRTLHPVRNDGNESINAWMAKIVALPSDRFAVVGSWADPDTISEDNPGKWQAFSQVIDSDGETVGSVVKLHFDDSTSQVFPDAAADLFGNLYVAWEDDEDLVQYNVIPFGAATPLSETAYDSRTENGGAGPSFAAYRAEDTPVYLAFTTLGADEGDVVLIDASKKSSGSTNVRLASSGETEFSPSLAASPAGGAAVYYSSESGSGYYVTIRGFTRNGSNLEKSSEAIRVHSVSVAPYQPAITHIKDDIYFVAWSEGSNPDFYIKGTFINLSETER